jgi:hypothetical protein
MAEGNREGIGCVGWLRGVGQVEQRPHHLLNLVLRCSTESRDAGLHLARRVTVRRNLRLRRREQDDAAHFRKFESRPNIESSENGFDGDRIRRKLLDEAGNQEMNFAEPSGEGYAAGQSQCAKSHGARDRAVDFDHSVPGRARDGRVHAQDAQLALARAGI